jgi:hypothetical protein
MFHKMLCLLSALALAFAFSACGKKAEEKAAERAMEKAIEKSGGGQVKVDLSQEQVKIKDQQGEAVFSAKGLAQIPGDFPKDVYVHPNTKVLLVQKINEGFHVLLESAEDPEPLVNLYKAKMKADGWKETAAMAMGATSILTYEKENRKAVVTISQSEKGKTGIQLQIHKNG